MLHAFTPEVNTLSCKYLLWVHSLTNPNPPIDQPIRSADKLVEYHDYRDVRTHNSLMPRLFLAVFPPLEVVELLGGLDRPEVEGLRWTVPEQWHITLRFFGETEQGEVEDSLRGFQGSASTVRLGPASRRLGARVLMLPADGLSELAAEVGARTAAIGQPPDRREFTGHLTLARARKRVPGTVVAQPFEAEFLARELWLVSSQLHPDGSRYSRLSHWPLEEAD